MTFAKRVQIFVVSQAVGTDARPEDDHGGCLIFQFATETPRDSLKVPEGEIQNSAADLLNLRACAFGGHTRPDGNRLLFRSFALYAV
jgi:hypothetical protein